MTPDLSYNWAGRECEETSATIMNGMEKKMKKTYMCSLIYTSPGTWYTGRPGGVSGYPRAWYRSVS